MVKLYLLSAFMSSNKNESWGVSGLWETYKSNFPRHLLGVSRQMQSETMQCLSKGYGHQQLRLGFEPYLSLVSEAGIRITELAEVLGLSKQACNQTANQIEKAGYIRRQADPLDGRAKRIVLTPRGRQLKLDGLKASADVQAGYSALTDERELGALIGPLIALDEALGLSSCVVASESLGEGDDVALFAGLLPRLADYITRRLMVLTMGKGHPDLKQSFGQVLTLIGPSGGRINHMAAIQKVSKQAISATVAELDDLGYVSRCPDPADARQVVIHFTPRGQDLIADSVQSVEELESEFQSVIGESSLEYFKRVFLRLYQGLSLEAEVFSNLESADIPALAHQLRQQLGDDGVKALVAQLLGV